MNAPLHHAHQPSSLWEATATEAKPCAPLQDNRHCDVLIIGAGYTGLCAALTLAQAGRKVCVVDAHQPGWGASGRNGGQVNPTLKHDPDVLIKMLGQEQGEKVIQAVSRSADLVFDLIAQHHIDCEPVRNGWLQVAYNHASVAGMHQRAEQWLKRGESVQVLSAQDVAQRTGTDAFVGGWLDGRAGTLQPLSYARGLMQAAIQAGAAVYGDSPIQSLKPHKEGWTAQTAQANTITAAQVLIATNGYTDGLWPGLKKTLLTANSFIVATEPLSGAAADTILSKGEAVSTSQRLLLYFRRDSTGRLLMGGRGHFQDPTSLQDYAHLQRALALIYPSLASVRYEYAWAGRVAITKDFMPHVHEPAPGLHIAVGYNGRGIALATSMGQHIAKRMLKSDYDFPFPISDIHPIALHGLQRFYIAAGVAWYSLLDRIHQK